jgi:hypothetical protein
MNGASKFVHTDWRRIVVVALYAHVWMAGSLAHEVPSIHLDGNVPGRGCVDVGAAGASPPRGVSPRSEPPRVVPSRSPGSSVVREGSDCDGTAGGVEQAAIREAAAKKLGDRM